MVLGRKKTTKRDFAIGLDLGSAQLKVVLLRRSGEGLELLDYAVLPHTLSFGRAGTEGQLSQAIQDLLGPIKIHDRRVFVAISSPSAVVTEIEMPRMPPDEIRGVLRINSTRFLRRDFSDYYFDAVELVDPAGETKGRKTPNMHVLVAGAPKAEVLWYRNALVAAKLRVETIELSTVAVINALQASHPDLCQQNVVLLLDIGARGTSLNFLRDGQPVLTRLIPFGSAQVTELIAVSLGVPTSVAEEKKRAMSVDAAEVVQNMLATLAREVRASIDFVERQQDCQIRHGFIGGGLACNWGIVEFLAQEVGLNLAQWNPLDGYKISAANKETLPLLAPSLVGAVGVAVGKL